MIVEQYLAALEAALKNMAPAEREEVVAEIRQHIADATAAGKPIDEVLKALGPVDALARAYQLELLVKPRENAPAQSSSDRWLKVIGLLAIGSLPTFIIVIVLGTIGLSFTLTGIGLMLAGIGDYAGALPHWVHTETEPWFEIIIGIALLILGLLSSWATYGYLRFVVRVVKRVTVNGRAA
jgi:uncharacterized membrane protein